MALSAPQDVASLLSIHAKKIALLRETVEASFPELRQNNQLEDGTVVDQLFYLRYILSAKAKDDISTTERITKSKTFANLSYALKSRTKSFGIVSKEAEERVFQSLPLLRTGRLANGYHVLYLPVKLVDLKKITSDKGFQNTVREVLISQRSKLYRSLDEETRSQGKLIKSVTVYDFSNVSLSQMFKMKAFHKVIQDYKKQFKRFFPQCTEQTVILNGKPLKHIMKSSKNRFMLPKDLIQEYRCAQAIPDLAGGLFRWPHTSEQLLEAAQGIGQDWVDCKVAPQALDSPVQYPQIVEETNLNKKMMQMVEREMVEMAKGKYFTIDVLAANQKVNLLFTNMKNKNANLVIIFKSDSKENDFRNRECLSPGFSCLSLDIPTKGEIQVAYLDSEIAKKLDDRKVHDFKGLKLRASPPRRMIRYGRKKLLTRNKKSTPLNNLDYMRAQQAGFLLRKKVLFRFEASETIVIGKEADVTPEKEKEFEEATQEAPIAVASEDWVDFEADSLASRDSIYSNTEASFLNSAAQILGQGILW